MSMAASQRAILPRDARNAEAGERCSGMSESARLTGMHTEPENEAGREFSFADADVRKTALDPFFRPGKPIALPNPTRRSNHV